MPSSSFLCGKVTVTPPPDACWIGTSVSTGNCTSFCVPSGSFCTALTVGCNFTVWPSSLSSASLTGNAM